MWGSSVRKWQWTAGYSRSCFTRNGECDGFRNIRDESALLAPAKTVSSDSTFVVDIGFKLEPGSSTSSPFRFC